MATEKSTRPEDTIIYFDLENKDQVVTGKVIEKEIQKFIKLKEKASPESNWGFVVFLEGEDNPSFLESLAEDEKEFMAFLGKGLKLTTKAHPLEQGIMLAATYLVEAYRVSDHVLRMIVISDGPSSANTDLANALMDMLERFKFFPLHVDIVRVGNQRVYKDDIKLKFITDITSGVLKYVDSNAAFKKAMGELLAIDRPAELATIASGEKGVLPPSIISEEKKAFYESLCWELEEIEDPDGHACMACGGGVDETLGPMLACGRCHEAIYHDTCAMKVSRNAKTGFVHVFRCQSCNCLLANDELALRSHFSMDTGPSMKGRARGKVSLGVAPAHEQDTEGEDLAAKKVMEPTEAADRGKRNVTSDPVKITLSSAAEEAFEKGLFYRPSMGRVENRDGREESSNRDQEPVSIGLPAGASPVKTPTVMTETREDGIRILSLESRGGEPSRRASNKKDEDEGDILVIGDD